VGKCGLGSWDYDVFHQVSFHTQLKLVELIMLTILAGGDPGTRLLHIPSWHMRIISSSYISLSL
jgi:hypothetical protein